MEKRRRGIVFKRNLLILWNGNISIVLSVFYGPKYWKAFRRTKKTHRKFIWIMLVIIYTFSSGYFRFSCLIFFHSAFSTIKIEISFTHDLFCSILMNYKSHISKFESFGRGFWIYLITQLENRWINKLKSQRCLAYK